MTTTQRPRPSRQAAPPPDPVPRGLILVAVAVALGVILLIKGGGVGFDRGAEDVEIGGKESTETTAVETTTTAPAAPATSVPPPQLQITALNAAGIDGYAGQTQNFLSVAGYSSVTAITGASLVEETAVHFAEGFEADALAVAEVLGLDAGRVSPLPADAQLARDPAEFPATTQVAVVLGPDVAPTVQGATAGAGEGDDTGGGATGGAGEPATGGT